MLNDMDLEHLKYPKGKFNMPITVEKEVIDAWIKDISELPAILKKLVAGLNENEFALTYRPQGWTIGQVIHHLADSHMNAFIRIKLALTEENPVIKPYFEERWANLPDVNLCNANFSLQILEGLHARWAILLNTLSPDDLNCTFYHPEHELNFPIINIIGMYAWHGKHHTEHIKIALKNKP